MTVPEVAVEIEVADVGILRGDWAIAGATGPLVVFAHGSGSSRGSPRNRAVAARLQSRGLGTLLLDLLTEAEERVEQRGGRLRFDVDQLADRLVAAVDWVDQHTASPPVGYFGASTGAAGALVASVRQGARISAIVSRGGRPDLAEAVLPLVTAPTLLIVGGRDPAVKELNEQAYARMRGPRRLDVVDGATHLFEEPGALEQVAELAAGWFAEHVDH
jgi:putative phosphoribosyl transferase